MFTYRKAKAYPRGNTLAFSLSDQLTTTIPNNYNYTYREIFVNLLFLLVTGPVGVTVPLSG